MAHFMQQRLHMPPLCSLLVLCSSLFSQVSATATAADWKALARELPGRLHEAAPLARPCFSTYNGQQVPVDQEQCNTVSENYLNTTFISNHYAGFYHLYGDGCISNTTDQCHLDTNDPGSLPGQCNQGVLSQYYIDVRGPEEVQKAFRFARRTGTPISIKASGHDYLGRSSRKGSLALWTRNLKTMVYHKSFKPAGSGHGTKGTQAITFGSGVNSDEAQEFAGRNKVTLVGPSSGTVAIVGGWSLFGGHSVLTPNFGLGVDRLLEITIVTPDGRVRVCNANKDPDLFWALRGGGGGVFGVVLSATVKVEPAMPLTVAIIAFAPPTPEAQKPFIQLLINNTASWSKQGWGGPMSASSAALVTPFLDVPEAKKSLAAAVNYVEQFNGSVVLFRRYNNFPDFYFENISPIPGDIGQGALLAFRVLPKKLHDTAQGRRKLESFLWEQVKSGDPSTSPTIFMTTPARYKGKPLQESGETSMHPAWRDSYWDVGYAAGAYGSQANVEERKGVARRVQQLGAQLEALAPEREGGAAYPNEANPWQRDWPKEFWGRENYARLAAVKKRYDPDGLLTCWRCVGFKDEWIRSEPAYAKCMGAFEGLV